MSEKRIGDWEKIGRPSFVKTVFQTGRMANPFEINRSGNTRVYQQAVLLLAFLSMTVSLPALSETGNAASIEQGEYIYRLGGCESCHADGSDESEGPTGGVELTTPFGTFVTPNITSDTVTGIGGWTAQQFAEAMKTGISPNGEHYYPSFPYTSYSRMPEQDLIDLKAYLDSLPPVSKVVEEHDLSFPFNQRWLMGVWKLLFFRPEPFRPDPSRTESWNRGAYIVNGPGHCVECHTPRNLLGALKTSELLAGNSENFDGESVPAINSALSKPFSQWSEEDIVFSLQTGMLPDGDFFGGAMGHVVENSTSRLSEPDLKAIAEYLQSPALPESSGIFSSLFGITDATAQENDRMLYGPETSFVGGYVWLFWLFFIAALIPFLFKAIGNRRRKRRGMTIPTRVIPPPGK